jgi:hypothetical protein
MLRCAWMLVAVIACLAGAGYWNYQRNADLDRELEDRPYRTLSNAQLKLLEQASRDELASYKQKLDMYSRAAASSGPSQAADLQSNLEAFGRVQANSEYMRDMQSEKVQHEVEIERIEKERQIRAAGLDKRWTRIQRRLLKF